MTFVFFFFKIGSTLTGKNLLLGKQIFTRKSLPKVTRVTVPLPLKVFHFTLNGNLYWKKKERKIVFSLSYAHTASSVQPVLMRN